LNGNYSPSIGKNVAIIPIDLADMGRSSAARLRNRGKPIEGTSLVLDVTIAVRWKT